MDNPDRGPHQRNTFPEHCKETKNITFQYLVCRLFYEIHTYQAYSLPWE